MTTKSARYLFIILAICPTALAQTSTLTDRFKQLDKDGDGKISDEERQAVRQKLRQMRTNPGAMTPSGKTETIGNREVTEMQYVSSDGRKIPCVLSMPNGDGPFPVLVTIHGGQGDRDFGYLRTMAAPNNLSPTVAAFNEQPWAILAISYRAGNGVLFGMEQDDVVAGIRFAKTLPKIDAARVGEVGGSLIGRGEKSTEERAEELQARETIIAFFKKQFARTDVSVVASPKVVAATTTTATTSDTPQTPRISAALRPRATNR
jgi:acetyl esterase/lipase